MEGLPIGLNWAEAGGSPVHRLQLMDRNGEAYSAFATGIAIENEKEKPTRRRGEKSHLLGVGRLEAFAVI